MDSNDLTAWLGRLLAEFREHNGGKDPSLISTSADVLALLRSANDPDRTLQRVGGSYRFKGVPLEGSKSQVLPFMFRP